MVRLNLKAQKSAMEKKRAQQYAKAHDSPRPNETRQDKKYGNGDICESRAITTKRLHMHLAEDSNGGWVAR